MATIKKFILSKNGTLLADIGGGLFVAQNGSMELAVCKRIPDGYRVVRNLVGGKMMRAVQDFADNVGFIRPEELAGLVEPKEETSLFLESARKTLDGMKEEVLQHIAAILERHGVDRVHAVDLDEDGRPVVIDNRHDGDLSFRLWRIRIAREETLTVEFQVDNSSEVILLDAASVDTGLLLGILEWLSARETHLEKAPK